MTIATSLDNYTDLRTDAVPHVPVYRAPKMPMWENRQLATQRKIDRFLRNNELDNRLMFCGTAVTKDAVGVILNRSRASFVGIARCDSWDCPRCARAKAGKSAARLAECMRYARLQGWVPYFLTLTMSHDTDDSLERCVRAAKEGWRKVRRKLNEDSTVHGHVVAWECTLGRSGWHLHAHVLVFLAYDLSGEWSMYGASKRDHQLQDGERAGYGERLKREQVALCERIEALKTGHKSNSERLKASKDRARCERDLWELEGHLQRYWWSARRNFHRAVATAWCDGIVKTGFSRPAEWRQHLVRARDQDDGLVNYLVKTAYEVTGGSSKAGRRGSWTPRGFLELAASGNLAGWSAWREYRRELKGMHRIAGIPQLEKKLAVATAERPTPVLIGAMSPTTYRTIRADSLDQPLLKMAELGHWSEGAWSVRDFLGSVVEYETTSSIRRKAADHWSGTPLFLHALVLDLVRVEDVRDGH